MHKSQAKITQLMKRLMTIGLLGAVLAVAVGFISINAISATPFLMAENELGTNESAYMIGHVEYTVRGMDGEIKKYVQADNLIVENGKDCAAQMIFDNSSSTACSITSSTTGFNFIAIGNDTDTVISTKTQLDDSTATPGDGCDGDSGTADTCEIQRTAGTVTIDTSGTDTIATITTATPFTFTDISSTTVQQSGLFDDGTSYSGNMFAMRDSLAIPVTSADTLTVTWKITLQ
jgi:hypothetical protein